MVWKFLLSLSHIPYLRLWEWGNVLSDWYQTEVCYRRRDIHCFAELPDMWQQYLLELYLNHFTYLQKNLKPVVLGIQTLPSVCWVPFSILWFGLSTEAILFVVVMGAAFSIAISVDNAIRNVPSIYKKAALTMGAQKQQMYRYVIFPACLPELISGLKQGWSFAWRALMAGEVMTTSLGLGQTLIMGRDLADINQVMLVMIVIILIGMLIDKCVFSVIEKQVMRKRE